MQSNQNSKRMSSSDSDQSIQKQKQTDVIDDFPLWAEAIQQSLAKRNQHSHQIQFRSNRENDDRKITLSDLSPVPSYYLVYSSFATRVLPNDIMQIVLAKLALEPDTQFSYHYESMPDEKILPQVFAVVGRKSEYCFLSIRLYICTGPHAKFSPDFSGNGAELVLVEFAKTAGDGELFRTLQSELRAAIEPQHKLPAYRRLCAPFITDDNDDDDTITLEEHAMSLLDRAMSPYIGVQREGVQGLANLPPSNLLHMLQDTKVCNNIISVLQDTLNICDHGLRRAGILLLQRIAENPVNPTNTESLARLWSDTIMQYVLDVLTEEPTQHTHEFHILSLYSIKQNLARIVMTFTNKHMIDTKLHVGILEQCSTVG